MIHLCACWYKPAKDDKWIDGVAVLRAPGTSDVITFIQPNGKPYDGNGIWDYQLWPANGAISISAGLLE